MQASDSSFFTEPVCSIKLYSGLSTVIYSGFVSIKLFISPLDLPDCAYFPVFSPKLPACSYPPVSPANPLACVYILSSPANFPACVYTLSSPANFPAAAYTSSYTGFLYSVYLGTTVHFMPHLSLNIFSRTVIRSLAAERLSGFFSILISITGFLFKAP